MIQPLFAGRIAKVNGRLLMAAFLAFAAFLANKAVKEVVAGETDRADATARLETNLLKTDVIEGNAELLRVIGGGKEAEELQLRRVNGRCVCRRNSPRPTPASATRFATTTPRRNYDDRHLAYEFAEVGLVLASVSIIIRRWLLGIGSAVGAASVVALVVGLLV